MRVGLETSVASFNRAGTARYSTELLYAFREHDFGVFDTVEINLASRFRVPKPGLSRKMYVLFWELIYCNIILPSLVRQQGIDLLHCTSPLPLRRSSLPTNIRLITTIYDVIPFSHPQWFSRVMGARLRRWIRYSISNSHHLIAISHFTKQELCSRLHIPNSHVSVTYLGKTTPSDLASIEVEPHILVVGTLEPRKNLTTVVEAYSIVKQNMVSPPKLYIVGDKGWGDMSLTVLSRRMDLESDVRLLGYVPDVKLFAFYKQAKMLVYPSLEEGFGLPVLEAMACGCPVITSNTSSLPEVVGEAGIMVDPQSSWQLAQAMHEVLSNPSLANEMRQKGIERAQRFSWQQCAQETADIYRRVMEDG